MVCPLAFPTIGFGTLLLKESCKDAVSDAMEAGCQLIDTGEHYGNLELVGQALKATPHPPCVLLKMSGIPTGEYATIRARVVSMLEKIGIEHAGVILIHWPGLCDWDPTDMAPLATPSDFQEKAAVSTWEIFRENIASGWANMVRLKEEGLTNEIGTSNFYEHHLDELAKQCDGALPFANEIFIDASNQEIELVAKMQNQGIRVIAYRPIIYKPFPDAVTKVADRLGISPQRVVLSWLRKRGISPIVKCRGTHIDENFKDSENAKDLLTDDDLERLKSADVGMKFSAEWFAKIWKTHNKAPAGVSEDDVQMLISMGVEEEKARQVLEKYEGDLDAAMDAAFT